MSGAFCAIIRFRVKSSQHYYFVTRGDLYTLCSITTGKYVIGLKLITSCNPFCERKKDGSTLYLLLWDVTQPTENNCCVKTKIRPTLSSPEPKI